jgi:hypothetical protein
VGEQRAILPSRRLFSTGGGILGSRPLGDVMVVAYKKIWINLRRLFARYPADEVGVSPRAWAQFAQPGSHGASFEVLAFQSVSDKFYFLLFGAFRVRMAARADVVIVRSVSGAVGSGWSAELKRSALVAWLWTGTWIRAYGHAIDRVAYRCATWMHPLADARAWIRSRDLWMNLQAQTGGENYSLQVGGIEIADLVISSYLRFKPAPHFSASDPFVRRLIWQALRDVRQAHAYFGRVKPRWYLTSYTTYLEHGIPVRVALQHGVDVWSFGNLSRFGKQLTLSDPYQTVDSSRYREDFEALGSEADLLAEARVQLEKRLSGGIDAATSYMRRSAYGASGEPAPRGLNGAVVVFLHDFYDSPHVYPDLVFDDFWQWICFTIETLRAQGVGFFLKPHPNQIELSDEALGLLRQQYPGLRWVSSTVTNVQLAQAGIACGVTVYGTVAHELAYLGVPSIGAARHPHHAFDFCRTARTRDEYESMLKTYAALPAPKEEMQRQALAFYYMHNLYGNEDQRVLRQAFVDFWKACNVGECTEESVMGSFHRLVELPAFERFVGRLTNI